MRHHVLRNSAIPVVTILGLQAGRLLGGAIVVEAVAGANGIGTLAIKLDRIDWDRPVPFEGDTWLEVAGVVIDGAGRDDPGPRVAAVLPDAFLRRPDRRGRPPGFAGAANDVLDTVQGAAFLVFCHDDVAPEPDALRLMVEESLRSNAGIVAPKLVDWDHDDRLFSVGLSVDKTGATTPLVDRGELDQEQHDSVRDVFAAASACLLVRADLFAELGGFDPAMADYGADVDLCWRAQVAGARVVVAPEARVRHREAAREAPGADPERARMEPRNHMRAMFKNYTWLHLLRVLPQAAVATIVEALVDDGSLTWLREAFAPELVIASWAVRPEPRTCAQIETRRRSTRSRPPRGATGSRCWATR